MVLGSDQTEWIDFDEYIGHWIEISEKLGLGKKLF
jgi:hypothetical protein